MSVIDDRRHATVTEEEKHFDEALDVAQQLKTLHDQVESLEITDKITQTELAEALSVARAASLRLLTEAGLRANKISPILTIVERGST